MNRMKLLYLAHRIPYPPNKGDKIRSFNEIKYLSRFYEIHLVCLADNPDDIQHKKKLFKFCSKVHVDPLDTRVAKIRGIVSLISGKSVTAGYFHSRKLQKLVDDLLSREHYDAILCFSSAMAEYLFCSIRARDLFYPKNGKIRLAMDFCDVDSDKWLQYSKNSSFPASVVFALENKRLLEYEKKINRSFHRSIFATHRELELFHRLFPGAINTFSVFNGVDFEYFSPSASYEKLLQKNLYGPVLLFTGAMDYHANIDGVLWFADCILPLIHKRFPQARFVIVGANPAPKITDLKRRNGIVVTGFVEDIRPYYEVADVCVIPLRLARGVQNKVLEAFAMAKPVVATAKAADGIGARAYKHLLVEDSNSLFADAVIKILNNPADGIKLGEKAREFVIENFNWSKNMKILQNIIDDFGNNRPPLTFANRA